MASFNLADIQIDLTDPQSISNAMTKIALIRNGLNQATKAIHEYLLSEGVKVTKAQIVRVCNPDFDPAGGELYASVQSEEFVFDETTGKGKGYITAGSGLKRGKDGASYAVYVEYGTGINAEDPWQKPSNSFGPKLKLPAKKTEPEPEPVSAEPMHFPHSQNGTWVTIYGQPPKHFMRDSMYELWQRAQTKWTELLRTYLPNEME